jgi:hypothetical protein
VAVWVRGDWVEAAVVDHGPAQPPHPHRPPTGSAAAAGGCGCLTVWSMRSGWSASSPARG